VTISPPENCRDITIPDSAAQAKSLIFNKNEMAQLDECVIPMP
jgi:hypothetical protein